MATNTHLLIHRYSTVKAVKDAWMIIVMYLTYQPLHTYTNVLLPAAFL